MRTLRAATWGRPYKEASVFRNIGRGRSQTGPPGSGFLRGVGAALAADRPAGAARPGGRALGNLQGERGKPLPYERNARFRVCAGEPLGAPAEMWAAFQEPTLIRHGFAVPPSPLEGEGLRAATSRPYDGKRTGSVGSANSGAVVEPHHSKFSVQQAAEGGPQRKAQRSGFALERRSDGVSELCPARAKRGIRNPRRRSGPAGIQTPTQILRAGNSASPCRYASPVMGSGGRLPLSGGDVAKRQRG